MIAEKLDEEEGKARSSSVDISHAYGQTPSHERTEKHCNFENRGWKINLE